MNTTGRRLSGDLVIPNPFVTKQEPQESVLSISRVPSYFHLPSPTFMQPKSPLAKHAQKSEPNLLDASSSEQLPFHLQRDNHSRGPLRIVTAETPAYSNCTNQDVVNHIEALLASQETIHGINDRLRRVRMQSAESCGSIHEKSSPKHGRSISMIKTSFMSKSQVYPSTDSTQLSPTATILKQNAILGNMAKSQVYSGIKDDGALSPGAFGSERVLSPSTPTLVPSNTLLKASLMTRSQIYSPAKVSPLASSFALESPIESSPTTKTLSPKATLVAKMSAKLPSTGHSRQSTNSSQSSLKILTGPLMASRSFVGRMQSVVEDDSDHSKMIRPKDTLNRKDTGGQTAAQRVQKPSKKETALFIANPSPNDDNDDDGKTFVEPEEKVSKKGTLVGLFGSLKGKRSNPRRVAPEERINGSGGTLKYPNESTLTRKTSRNSKRERTESKMTDCSRDSDDPDACPTPTETELSPVAVWMTNSIATPTIQAAQGAQKLVRKGVKIVATNILSHNDSRSQRETLWEKIKKGNVEWGVIFIVTGLLESIIVGCIEGYLLWKVWKFIGLCWGDYSGGSRFILVYMSLFLFAEFFFVFGLVDAAWNKNSLQIVVWTLFNIGQFSYTLIQRNRIAVIQSCASQFIAIYAADPKPTIYTDVRNRTSPFDPSKPPVDPLYLSTRDGTVSLDLTGGCPWQFNDDILDKLNNALSFMNGWEGFQTVIPVISGLGIVVLAGLGWNTIKEFKWKQFQLQGASLRRRYMILRYHLFIILLKLNIFCSGCIISMMLAATLYSEQGERDLITGFTTLTRLYPGAPLTYIIPQSMVPTAKLASSLSSNIVTTSCVSILFAIMYICLGWYAIRKSNVIAMSVFVILVIADIGAVVYVINLVNSNEIYLSTKDILIVFCYLKFFLNIITIINGIWSTQDFKSGLRTMLDAQRVLANSDTDLFVKLKPRTAPVLD
ncbi:hypothetical protein BCR33DRAFT_713671 [Rhizoclosmatium globosum]|uniref:Uncharacterized protein n=1 Tax=Rhizoclosmatium globosum TaxID=329046 RepID=A0A1Y2CUV3_9FUNG|nr:hypothetical protein BCR33DRAFT_713671 [Rhizoclosmatium globosum]|eukprot:ORY50095.1 hypothetical protein BCR33DRAFT_713671 [Rhizoclosmatium globosum]